MVVNRILVMYVSLKLGVAQFLGIVSVYSVDGTN